MNFAQELEQLKQNIRDKWINYYQENQDWLDDYASNNNLWASLHKEYVEANIEIVKQLSKNGKDYSPRRLESSLLLGFVAGLEPSAAPLIKILCLATTDPDSIIFSLGLVFDPLVEYEKQIITKDFKSELDDIREQIKLQNGEH